MMHDLDLPTSIWAEATGTAVYVQNRCPHFILGGVKLDVEHLRIFGSPMYIHVPKEKRSKMGPSGKKGIFVGYSETSKAYRIYIPRQRYIEVSRDVTFHKEVVFQHSRC